MNPRHLVMRLALTGVLLASACGADNDREFPTPPPTETGTRLPTNTPLPALSPTKTATQAVSPTSTGTPQVSPTRTLATGAVCGNGTLDSNEQCDDGNLLGGDGCAANCAEEVSLSCKLGCVDLNDNGKCGESEGDAGGVDLDSGAVVYAELFPLTLLFEGTMTLTAGKPLDTEIKTTDPQLIFAPDQMPVVLKQGDLRVEPVKLTGVTCACVQTVETPEFGPGNAGGGGFGCNQSGLDEVSYVREADHRINDVDPTCATGFLEDGTANHPHVQPPLGPACNDLGEAVFTGGGPRGSLIVSMQVSISLISDGGACERNCSVPDMGPDCLPCTDDDQPSIVILDDVLVATTGTVLGRVLDANNNPGLTIVPPKPRTGLTPDCGTMSADPNAKSWDLAGSATVNSIGLIDAPSLGDAVAVVTLACVPPER
jgi:cysteine-rich repeat protein